VAAEAAGAERDIIAVLCVGCGVCDEGGLAGAGQPQAGGPDPQTPRYIITEPGAGYRFVTGRG
jgi:hypothetical protein